MTAATTSPLLPLLELLNGAAYRAHPGDAALSPGRRFAGRTLLVVGGGGTGLGWTQRICFDRNGEPSSSCARSKQFKRGTEEWTAHLGSEAGKTCGWAVILVEQQWQAAFATSSGASSGASGVEQMLRVRDAGTQFGGDRLSADAIRVAIDHPTMEGSVVGGVRAALVEQLEREALSQGLQVAAVRVSALCLLEQYFAELAVRQVSPPHSLVVFDGQSALIVGIREGAFDAGEGGISYVVNRTPAEVRSQVLRRIGAPYSVKEWGGRIDVIGSSFCSEGEAPPPGVELDTRSSDLVLSSVGGNVRHDFRTELHELRGAVPRWIRPMVAGSLLLIIACAAGIVFHVCEGIRVEQRADLARTERAANDQAASRARNRIGAIKQEELRARRLADWVDRNYHAQALVHSFLSALPLEVSLDAVALQAAEGLPQARLKFTLLGAEEAQREALRSIEKRLYVMGYEIGRRDDPVPATSRHGGVIYGWDLILPNFGR